MTHFLTADAFRHAIRRGLGRALLHLKHNPDSTYEDEILYACTHYAGYDPQCWGVPESYLWHAMSLAGCRERQRRPIIDAMLAAEDDHDFWQCGELVLRFARRGDREAREAIYAAFDTAPADDPERGSANIMELDDLRGLLHVARRLGRLILDGAGEHIDRDLPYLCVEKEMEEAFAELNTAAETDADVRAYRDFVAEGKRVQGDRPRTAAAQPRRDLRKELKRRRSMPFDELLKWARGTDGQVQHYPFRLWAKHADRAQLEAAAHAIESSDDPQFHEACLWAFQEQPYPGDVQFVLRLIDSSQEMLGFRAVNALAHTRHPAIRQYYLNHRDSIRALRPLFMLLVANFERGDEIFILDWFQRHSASADPHWKSSDQWTLHTAGYDLLEICRANPTADLRLPMHFLYENTICHGCRWHAVELIRERGWGTAALWEECRWDAVNSIRNESRRARREAREEK